MNTLLFEDIMTQYVRTVLYSTSCYRTNATAAHCASISKPLARCDFTALRTGPDALSFEFLWMSELIGVDKRTTKRCSVLIVSSVRCPRFLWMIQNNPKGFRLAGFSPCPLRNSENKRAVYFSTPDVNPQWHTYFSYRCAL